MLKKIYFPLHLQARKCAAAAATAVETTECPNKTGRNRQMRPNVNLKAELDPEIRQNILDGKFKPRKHDGVIHKAAIRLPQWLEKAAKQGLEDYQIKKKEIKEEAEALQRYLWNRRLPPETVDVNNTYSEIRDNIEESIDPSYIKPEDFNKLDHEIDRRAKQLLHQNIYHWKPIAYDTRKAWTYLLARAPSEYSALYKIFSEINKRDPKFRPKNVLDFGSGIGTVAWVASEFWEKSIVEYLGIDISEPMNNIAQRIVAAAEPKLRHMFFKQYFPITSPPYDLVVSSYSLMELPSRKTRIETVLNLWKKTTKYLVLVEAGTNAGFQIITEARNFLIKILQSHREKQYYNGYIFAPCPHELPCQRVTFDDTPCNFDIGFYPFRMQNNKNLTKRELFTYLVIKKGAERSDKDSWPRIVRPVLTPSRRSICRICASNGNLEEIIFTKSKHEDPLFRCARKSDWGDRLPIKITYDAKPCKNADEFEMNDENLSTDDDSSEEK